MNYYRPPSSVGARVRAAPFELAIGLIALATGVINVNANGTAAGVVAMWLYVALALGGAFIAGGIVADQLDAESAGLVLMLGAYVCLVLQTAHLLAAGAQADTFAANASGVTLALIVRLYVVRKAARARRRVGRRRRGG